MKYILTTLTLLFLASFAWLMFQESQERDYRASGSHWSAYFLNPKDSSLTFKIENKTKTDEFIYTLYQGETALETKSIYVPSGGSQAVLPGRGWKKIDATYTVDIQRKEEKRKLYKNLP